MSRQIPVVAQDAAGNAVAGASITIVNRQTGQAPVVYTTETGGSARSLPLTTGVNGRPPESWVDRAAYLITVTAPAIGTDVMAWDAADARDEAVDAAWLAQSQRWMPGDVKQTTRSAAPPGWLKAIGVTLARADYAALWAVAQGEIAAGNQIYGAGDGTTTFVVADLSRRVLIGAGAAGGLSTRALGAGGGEEAQALTLAQSPAHGHTVSSHNHGGGVHAHPIAVRSFNGDSGGNNGVAGTAGTALNGIVPPNQNNIGVQQSGTIIDAQAPGTDAKGGGQSHNNMPPFVTVHTLIKT